MHQNKILREAQSFARRIQKGSINFDFLSRNHFDTSFLIRRGLKNKQSEVAFALQKDFTSISKYFDGRQDVCAVRLLGSSVSGVVDLFQYDVKTSMEGDKIVLERIKRNKPKDADIEILTAGKLDTDFLQEGLISFRHNHLHTIENSMSLGLIDIYDVQKIYKDKKLVSKLISRYNQDEISCSFIVDPYLRFVALQNQIVSKGKSVYNELKETLKQQISENLRLRNLFWNILGEYFLYSHIKAMVKLGKIDNMILDSSDFKNIYNMEKDDLECKFGLYNRFKV